MTTARFSVSPSLKACPVSSPFGPLTREAQKRGGTSIRSIGGLCTFLPFRVVLGQSGSDFRGYPLRLPAFCGEQKSFSLQPLEFSLSSSPVISLRTAYREKICAHSPVPQFCIMHSQLHTQKTPVLSLRIRLPWKKIPAGTTRGHSSSPSRSTALQDRSGHAWPKRRDDVPARPLPR